MTRLLIALLAGFFFALPEPDAASITDVYASIKTLSNGCTTFSINRREGFWMTAAHCWGTAAGDEEGPPPPLRLEDHPTHFVAGSPFGEWDLVVYRTGVYAKSLRLNPIPPQVGDQLIVVGYPYHEGVLLPFWHRVAARNMVWWDEAWLGNLVTDGHTAPGMSGSPVFSAATLRVVSLHQGARRIPPFESVHAPYDEFVRLARPFWDPDAR